MPIDVGVLLSLVAAAFCAGWVDAVVGGGGLIQLPALLLGLPADTAVATVSGTNKVSSVAGTGMATATYARRIRFHWPTAAAIVAGAAAASSIGAQLVHFLPRAWFTPLVLVVLVVVGTYTVRRPQLGMVSADKLHGPAKWLAGGAIGLVVGLYDGFIGPGTGTFFIIAIVAILGFGFLEASAYAKLANLVTNLSAIAVFASTGHILWLVALPMAAANLAGGFIGARLAVRHGNGFVRKVFLVVVGALALKLGWDTVAPFFT